MLKVEKLVSAYGRIEVLHGIDLEVHQGEIVTIVGANGAGKTTLLRAISGVQPIRSGQISFLGQRIDGVPGHKRTGLGIAQAPEGRQVFSPLSVEDNLRLGAWSRTDKDVTPELERVYTLFPILKTKRDLAAGGLSGGQQQMLAIGRALMAKPKLVLLDEPSMGLAPILVDQIFEVIRALKAEGQTVLLVEQNAFSALSLADRGYVLETGRVALTGTGSELVRDPRIRETYLGQ